MRLRDESTPDGRAIWADVDKAASRAPKWLRDVHHVRDAFWRAFPEYTGEFDLPEATRLYRALQGERNG